MDVDRGGLPQATSSNPGHKMRLDRRRLMKGAVALSFTEATRRVGTLKEARAAMVRRDSNGIPETTKSRSSTGDMKTGACLEAALHVMMH